MLNNKKVTGDPNDSDVHEGGMNYCWGGEKGRKYGKTNVTYEGMAVRVYLETEF
jgi:hypothetical protein